MKKADPTLLNDTDFSVQVTPERVEKPASRWRNKFFAHGYIQFQDRAPLPDGGEWLGSNVHPSKEVAETKADEWMEKYKTEWRYWCDVDYLGAVAVEGDA